MFVPLVTLVTSSNVPVVALLVHRPVDQLFSPYSIEVLSDKKEVNYDNGSGKKLSEAKRKKDERDRDRAKDHVAYKAKVAQKKRELRESQRLHRSNPYLAAFGMRVDTAAKEPMQLAPKSSKLCEPSASRHTPLMESHQAESCCS
jgi:hypothetical protein